MIVVVMDNVLEEQNNNIDISASDSSSIDSNGKQELNLNNDVMVIYKVYQEVQIIFMDISASGSILLILMVNKR